MIFLLKICINFRTQVLRLSAGYSFLPHSFIFKSPSNFFCLDLKVSEKMPPGKKPTGKKHPRKLPSGNMPTRKIAPWKNSPRKNAPQENWKFWMWVFLEKTYTKYDLLRTCFSRILAKDKKANVVRNMCLTEQSFLNKITTGCSWNFSFLEVCMHLIANFTWKDTSFERIPSRCYGIFLIWTYRSRRTQVF